MVGLTVTVKLLIIFMTVGQRPWFDRVVLMRLLFAICRPVDPVPGIPTQLENERARVPPLVVYTHVLYPPAQPFSNCG